MIHVLISGALGSMGRQVAQAIEADPDFTVIAGVDIHADDSLSYPVYEGFGGVKENPDIIFDFSRADALEGVLEFAMEKKLPTVICTTGHTPSQKAYISKAALS
ncbi:MAG: 4-hydroxy-tetrahydrodipicolinate reductase, partial [Christensenellales bacterium]